MERMESIVVRDFKPDLNKPILIEGLPGVGNVGKIVADFISSKMNAKRMVTIYSEDLPPQVIVDEECVANMACNELWVATTPNGQDLIFLLGDYQGTSQQGQFSLSKCVMDLVLPYDPSMIITLGGYGTGNIVNEPRVLGAVSDSRMRSGLEAFGVGFYPNEPQGGIVGAAAVLLGLGKIYGIDSVCIMGETSGFIVDHKSAKNVVGVLGRMLCMEFDTTELQDEIDRIDEITSIASKESSVEPEEDLIYIR